MKSSKLGQGLMKTLDEILEGKHGRETLVEYKKGYIIEEDSLMEYKFSQDKDGKTVKMYYGMGYNEPIIDKLALTVIIGSNGEFKFYTPDGNKDICTAEYLLAALQILDKSTTRMFAKMTIVEGVIL